MIPLSRVARDCDSLVESCSLAVVLWLLTAIKGSI